MYIIAPDFSQIPIITLCLPFSWVVCQGKKVALLLSLWYYRRWCRRRCRCCERNVYLGYNFKSVAANIMKLHTLVFHHKGYTLTNSHNPKFANIYSTLQELQSVITFSDSCFILYTLYRIELYISSCHK